MSFIQHMKGYRILIPEEKVTPFIKAVRESGLSHTIDEPGKNHPISFIDLEGWWLMIDPRTRAIHTINDSPIHGGSSIDDDVMNLIAKFSKDGFIEMTGGDNHWRWVFRNGKASVIQPVITWPEPTED